jgi:hypothetical protein
VTRESVGGSRSSVVEVLKKVMRSELDLLVPPLGRSVLTSDQAHPMDTPEIAVDECMPGLGVIGRTVRESQMPGGVLIPRVRLEKVVLVVGTRLNVAPHAVEHVLVGVDQPSRLRDRIFIERVGRHELASLPKLWRGALGVNTNTVPRSLRVLRDEGLLEFRRGRGISVAGTPERGAVVQRARELVAFARSQGYRIDELVEIIEDVG